MSNSVFFYELGTTEKITERWSFLEANATWRFSALDGVRLLLYREDYEGISDALESGGVYEIYCSSGESLVTSLEAVRSTCFALGHYLCVALKTQFPVSFGESMELAWPTVYDYDEFPNCPKCGARALLPEVEEIPEVWVSTCKGCNKVTTFSQETNHD